VKTYQVKLTPKSQFHAFPTSDTLFGALCWGIKRLHGEDKLHQILAQFDTNSPPFILSSAFPMLENRQGKTMAFFQKPVSIGLKASDIEGIANKLSENNFKKSQVKAITGYKKFKKYEYISETILGELLETKSDRDIFEEYLITNEIKSSGNMLMKKSEHDSFFEGKEHDIMKVSTVQKNSIDRLTMSTGEEGQTFYEQEIYTSGIFRLHFLIKTSDIEFLLPVFKYLEDKGIGGNRSTGKGRFKIEMIGEKSLPTSTDNKTFVSLSRFIPATSKINWQSERTCYEVFPYRSKIDSEGDLMDENENVWKNRVMYLKEGSVFEANEYKAYYGQCPVIKETHGKKIRQNGLAFPVFGSFGGMS
jgi:CRISPR-associated protein Csm4